MSSKDSSDPQSSRSLPMSPEERESLDGIVDEVFELEIEDALSSVSQKMRTLDRSQRGSALELLLQALWCYFEAIRLIRADSDFAGACLAMQEAAQGFAQVEQHELLAVSRGLVSYSKALAHLQKSNIGEAQELFRESTNYLKDAGRFGQQFRPLIDHMKPEQLYISGMQSLQMLDFASARSLIEQASLASEKVANDYHQKGSPHHCTFLGLAQFYRANFTFVRAVNDLNNCSFDKLIGDDNLAVDANQACDLLRQGDLENINIRNTLRVSEALVDVLQAVKELARITRSVLRSTFKFDLSTLADLRKRIEDAKSAVSQLGPAATAHIRFYDSLLTRSVNLERFAKPNKKDWGAYSGLVAAGVFLPLFVIASWANMTFEVGVHASMLFTSCIFVALIAGFGVGALKFKTLFAPTPAEAQSGSTLNGTG